MPAGGGTVPVSDGTVAAPLPIVVSGGVGATAPSRAEATRETTIALSGAGEENQVTHSTLFLGERQGGTTLLVGSAEFNTLYHSTQAFLDAVFALTFGSRDPGPPPARDESTGAQAAPPSQPATPPAPAGPTP